MDPSEVEATGTPNHKVRVDGPSAHETPVPEASAHDTSCHETPDQATSEETFGWGTWPDQPEGPSGHADDGGEPTDIEEEGAPSTSVVLLGSRPCRRPASRGG